MKVFYGVKKYVEGPKLMKNTILKTEEKNKMASFYQHS